MAEAKRLKSGRWRIYRDTDRIVRDPATGAIANFRSFSEASRWWALVNPQQPSLQEAHKCARCGAYFGPSSPWAMYQGRPYHLAHLPKRQ
jgi:hypothetical protein